MKHKKIIVKAGIILAIGAIAGGSIFYIKNHWRQEDAMGIPGAGGRSMLRGVGMPQGAEGMPPGAVTAGEAWVTATGTIAAGMTEKELELDFLETDLVVEEVFVNSADEVEQGAKILKITENSLLEATRELERAKMDGALAYRQGVIDFETKKIEADKELAKIQIEAEFAQTAYEDALARAQAEVTRAENAVAEAQELVDEYTDAIEKDSYYEEYGIDEKKAAYDRNVALFFEKLEEYGYELDDDEDDDPNTYNIVKAEEKGMGGGQSADQSNDGESTVLQMLKSEYQENKKEYDQALTDYEAAKAKAEAGIGEAENTLQIKQLALQEAVIAQEKAKTSAQADYDLAMVKGEKAQAAYDTKIKKLQEELDILSDEKDETAENYETFMATMGDGFIYTEKAGTIFMVRAVANTSLEKDGILMAYSNPDIMQVTASVDQADIAALKVDEVAAVVTQEYGTYTGIVTAINPMTFSESKASVSYQVVLELSGDTDKLSANVTADVIFGITGEEYEKMNAERMSDEKKQMPGEMKPGEMKPDEMMPTDMMPGGER